ETRFFNAGGQVPAKQWRWDQVPAPDWIGVPISSAVLSAFTAKKFFAAGGQVPAKFWRWDHVPEPVWAGAPAAQPVIVANLTALTNFALTGTPWRVEFLQDVVYTFAWVSAPVLAADALNALALGTPPTWSSGVAAEQAVWAWTPPTSNAVIQPAASYYPSARQFCAPRAAPVDIWAWAPPSLLLAELSTYPFSKTWHYDYSAEPIWQGAPEPSLALTDFSGSPFAAVWRWNHVPEPVWQGAPTTSPIIADLSGTSFTSPWRPSLSEPTAWIWKPSAPQSAANPFVNAWLFSAVPDPVWSNVPAPSPLFATGAGDFVFALVGTDINWALNLAELTSWAWSPPNRLVYEPTTGEPFSKLWRYDLAVEATWQGSPGASPALADFAAKPFNAAWRYDLAEVSSWAWAPPPLRGATPFARAWRADLVIDAVWQGAPAIAPALADFAAKPIAISWQPNLAELTGWAWEPPSRLGYEPTTGEPFAHLWRYDFSVEAIWRGAPDASPVIADFSGRPFTASWQPNLAEPVAWAWMAPKPQASSAPFTRLWHYDLGVEAVWQGSQGASHALVDFNAAPFATRWQSALTEVSAWAWTVQPRVAIAELAIVEPFARLWRYDLAVEPVWQGAP